MYFFQRRTLQSLHPADRRKFDRPRGGSEGKRLEEAAAIARCFADNMATLAVALQGTTPPSTGMALVDLGACYGIFTLGVLAEEADGADREILPPCHQSPCQNGANMVKSYD